MPATRGEFLARLLASATTDPRIVGVLDYGSTSEGRGDEWSDVDLVVFLRDADAAAFEGGWKEWLGQFAPVLLEMSDAIRTGRAPFPDGVEGMADIRVIEAIKKSLRTGRRVKPAAMPKEPRQALPKSRARRVRPHPEPALIGASGPSG